MNEQIKVIKKETIHQFKVKDINGKEFDFSSLKGKRILIVNTASECGFTPQYKELEELYKKFKSKNFVVIGFPCNDFGAQEPGSDIEIAQFCEKNYEVTFPIMGKISILGDSMHPVYQFLTKKVRNGLKDSEVKWNFQKYLIDENGELVDVLSSRISPSDKTITDFIAD